MKYSRNLGLSTGIELVKLVNYTDVEQESSLPANFNLSQNYPNPFNPVTTIKYSIPVTSNVNITVFDATGKVVQIIENKERSAGTYSVSFDAKQMASGVYYYQITAGNFVNTKKLVLIK